MTFMPSTLAYFSNYKLAFSGAFAMGYISIPVLSLLFIVVAFLTWPRRSRAVEAVGLVGRRRVLHWIFVLAAFVLAPYGTWKVDHPWHNAPAPKGERAQQLITRLLSNAYQAFNISDEETLYDRLAESVSEDLVADMYLQGRRRLLSDVQDGDTVTIQTVDVLSLGAPETEPESRGEYTYSGTWSVAVRIQHLEHVHNRRNTYTGELSIGIRDDSWKLTSVTLKTEERVVLP